MRNCPVCARVLRNQLLDRVKEWFADDEVRFMTVTMRIKRDGSDVASQNARLMKCWHVLMVDLKRMYPGIRGWWMKEPTKRGAMHLHALVTRYVDIHWLKRRWHEITGDSYQCWMEEAFEIKNTAAYMMKYMTKQVNGEERFLKGERHYGFFGAKAPPVKLLGFEEKVTDFELDPHFNPASVYWLDFYYKPRFEKYGPVAVEFINRALLNVHDRYLIIQAEIELGYHDEPKDIKERPQQVEPERPGPVSDALRKWRELQDARADRAGAMPEPVRSPYDHRQKQLCGKYISNARPYRPPSEFLEARHAKAYTRRPSMRDTGGLRDTGPCDPPG